MLWDEDETARAMVGTPEANTQPGFPVAPSFALPTIGALFISALVLGAVLYAEGLNWRDEHLSEVAITLLCAAGVVGAAAVFVVVPACRRRTLRKQAGEGWSNEAEPAALTSRSGDRGGSLPQAE